MKRWMWCCLALLGVFEIGHAGGSSDDGAKCTARIAQIVEESIEEVESWEQFSSFYKKYRMCDRPALSDGFTQKMAELAARSDGVTSLWKQTEKQRWFRAVVAKKMQSESIPLDTTEKILENLKSRCPQSAKMFCHDLRVRIKKTCQACDPDK